MNLKFMYIALKIKLNGRVTRIARTILPIAKLNKPAYSLLLSLNVNKTIDIY